MRFLLPTALLFLCIGVCQAASPSLYIAPQAAGDSSGSSCPNAHPFAFFNNPDNWGTDLGQISPGTTLHVCGPIPHETKSILTAQRDGKPGAQIVVTLEKGASPQRLAELVDLNGKKNVVLNEPQLTATPEKAVAVPHVVAPTFTVYQNANSVGEGPRNYCGADTGTANAYACANPANAAIKAYRQGNTYSFTASHANTGVSTLAIDGLAATTIKKQQGLADLAANDILANATVQVLYDGTWFELISPLGNTASGSGVLQIGRAHV